VTTLSGDDSIALVEVRGGPTALAVAVAIEADDVWVVNLFEYDSLWFYLIC
jgi:hypothetical protein